MELVIFCGAESVFILTTSVIPSVKDIVFVLAVIVIVVWTVPIDWVFCLNWEDSMGLVKASVVFFLGWSVSVNIIPLLSDCKTTNEWLNICAFDNVDDLLLYEDSDKVAKVVVCAMHDGWTKEIKEDSFLLSFSTTTVVNTTKVSDSMSNSEYGHDAVVVVITMVS